MMILAVTANLSIRFDWLSKEIEHAMEIPEDLVGGHLAIDFSNCINRFRKMDYMERTQFLLAWSVRSGTLSPEAAEGLAEVARRHPGAAHEVAGRALELAQAGRGLLLATAGGQPPPVEHLAVVNRELAAALPHLAVRSEEPGFAWTWDGNGARLERALWPVARALGELLVSDSLSRVKECASDTCSWVFLDSSRNRCRRWCDMSSCGNREKARRHRAARRAPGSGRAKSNP